MGVELYFKVAGGKAEDVRRRLIELGVFDRTRKVSREGGFVFLPVVEEVSLGDGVMAERKPVKAALKPRSLREALEGKLSPGELEVLPSGFDVVGDVAVLDLPEGLLKRKKLIGDTLLGTFSNIRVVAVKKSSVKSRYRIREVEVVAGVNRTVTTHKEHGCLYRLDVASTYFSPRLGSERLRVAGKVKANERVLVLFAGVGPFPVLIAKRKNAEVVPYEGPTVVPYEGVSCSNGGRDMSRSRDLPWSPKGTPTVVAVELNPVAVEFMRENARVNKVNVRVVEGDVRNVVPNLGRFDRIIMPLPKDAGSFLDVALPALNKNGVIHFYDFAETPEESAEKVKEICGKLGYKIKVLDSVYCGSYSPKLNRVCVDFKLLGRNT